MNICSLVGNLGNDPELRKAGELSVTNLSIATSEYSKSKGKYTEWHTVVLFGKTAENAVSWLRKGGKVGITGKLSTSSWAKEDGTKAFRTQIIGNDFESYEKKALGESDNVAFDAKPSEVADSEIPF